MNKAWFRVERPVGIDLAVLATMLVLVFLPVLQALPMPTTGDQKTYISQAVEMAQAHSWFKQTLFGQPNYYKGPLLLLCLRLGWLLFGPYTAASLIYMNVAGFAVLTFALYRLLRVRLPEDRAAGLLVPAVVVLSCGTYAHALASQMEALLITFYGLFMVLLGLAEAGERGKILRRTAWIVAGLAGLLKSPLHSVLLGTSGLLFWALTKQLVGLWQRRSEWVSLLLGVGVCTAGYAPAFLSDPRHFIASFVVREHLVRGGNGVSLLAAWLPFSFGHLLPWVPVLIVGALGWRSPPISTFSPDSRRLWQLALAMMLPTALFFSAHAYHSDLYFLPLVPSLALGFGLMVRSAVLAGSRGVLVGQWTLFTLVVVLAALVVAAVERFAPWPAWWQAGTELWIYGLFALSVSLLGLAPFLAWPTTRVRLTILGLAASFAAVGHLLVQLNAHEVQALTEATAGHEELTWGRLNLKGNVWAETGVMTVMLKHPVGGVNSSADLSKMLQPGRLFLVPDDAQLRQLQEAATAANLNVSVKAYPRWRIHGMTTKGESAWGLAWRSRRLTPLEQTEYVALTSGRAPVASIAPGREHNVILITWDGVRIDEFLGLIDPTLKAKNQAPVLSYFWNELAPLGRVYGDRAKWQFMTVGNPDMVSLPAYESIFAGYTQPCHNNDCDRIETETFPERLVRDLHVPREQVASFGSWETLAYAIEAKPGATMSDIGLTGPSALNGEETPPWNHARFDKYTWQHAMAHLDRYHPRFLYIGLDDSDERGHYGEYDNYLTALRTYDDWLRQLVARLAAMGEYGRDTCLIVTSDHGRGLGSQWVSHSNSHPYSAFTLMYMGCPLDRSTTFREPTTWTTHLVIRPTVESLLGLPPQECLLCANSLLTKAVEEPTDFVAAH